jgi:hypothetical protein
MSGSNGVGVCPMAPCQWHCRHRSGGGVALRVLLVRVVDGSGAAGTSC